MSLTALSLAESDSLDIGGAPSGNLACDKMVLLLHIQHTYVLTTNLLFLVSAK